MGETEEFNTLAFEKKLMQLKDTQESIQALSSWCLKQKSHHKKIVSSWLNVLKRVKVEQRLTLFYLANDVIQYSKRKGYEFVDSWGLNLQKATPLVRDEKVRPKILRIFKIWEQRAVYDEEFLSDLTGLLSAGATKKTDDDPLDFQPQQLVNKIKQCKVLEGDTEVKLKSLLEQDLELSDADELCSHLKDRSIKHDVIKELNEGISCVEKYTQALQREIVARETLLALLNSANQYYSTQRGEVKVVAYAYKNFGSRVRTLKRKLDELLPTLPSSAPSPPQRDEDVPSPGPDEDLELPGTENDNNDVSYDIDQTFSTSISADGSLYNLGLSSFLTSDNPLAIFNESIDLDPTIEGNIEVISTRVGKQDIIDCMLKEVVTIDSTSPGNTSVGSVVSASLSQKSQDALPGLDLLTLDSTGNPPPPISFYGTMNSLNEEAEVYVPPVPAPVPVPSPWAAAPVDPHATWIPPPTSARNVFAEPPASPPPGQRAPLAPTPLRPDRAKEAPPADVDQRGLLPPPPPPPPILPLLGQTEDVDHRLLPPTNVPPPARHTGQQDIDHRNLISLTHQPQVQQTHNNLSLDQDYRVPPLAPTDIVESVDMDLSDDDEQGMYQESNRRNSFNNNKVLVGGDEINNMNNASSTKNRHDGSHTAPAQMSALPPRFPPAHGPPVTPQTAQSLPPLLMPPATSLPRMASTAPRMASTMPPAGTKNAPAFPLDMPPPPDMHNTLRDMQNAPRDMHNAPRDMHNARDMHSAPRDMRNDVHNAPPRGTHNEDATPRGPHNTHLPPPSMLQGGPMARGQGPPGPRPRSAPIIPPLANPFDNMPSSLKFNMPNFQDRPPNYDDYDENEEYDKYEDPRNRGDMRQREPSPEYPEYEEEWSQQGPRPMNPRFPRNWSPRTNFRPNFSPQFRPRGGPRTPNRWGGPRGQRQFW